MEIKILPSSKEIKAAIKDIFSVQNQRRVAISAFVGDEANAYLPYPQGIELYCWPKAGGTNPTAIRDLQKRGVKVYFSDSLHMKLYWSKKGVVITSANLSTYALGAGGLKEIGVLLSAKSVDINKTIQSLNARDAEETEIVELEKTYKKILRTNPNLSNKPNEEYSFENWYDLKSHKEDGDWRLASYTMANVKLSKKAGDKLEKEHGSKFYNDILETSTKEYKQDDWILCYVFNGKKPVSIEWMYAHHIIRDSRKYRGQLKYYYQTIQVSKLKAYHGKPFKIDTVFREAFINAYKEYYKVKENRDEVIPSKDFLLLIYEKFKNQSG